MEAIFKEKQYYKFSLYGFLKNLRFFEAFFILFLSHKGLSYTQIGVLYAVREIFINVFELPSGIIADTYGRKKALITSFVAYIISFYIFFLAVDFWWFLIAFIAYGVGDAFRSGSHKAMIMAYLKLNDWEDQKKNYYGHTRSWSQKGSAVSSLIAGIIVFYGGTYQNIFLYSIVPYLLNLLLILSYPNEIDQIKPKKQKKKIALTFKSFLVIFKQAKVLKIIGSSAVHSAYLKSIKDYIQLLMLNVILILPLLMDVAFTKRNGLFIGVFYFLIFLLNSKASKWASKIKGSNTKIANITLLLGLSFGLISGLFFESNYWVLSLLAFIGVYLMENLRKPVLTADVSDHVPNEILASVLSAQSLLKTILTAIFSIAFGVLADRFNIGVALMILSISLIVFSVVLSFIQKDEK